MEEKTITKKKVVEHFGNSASEYKKDSYVKHPVISYSFNIRKKKILELLNKKKLTKKSLILDIGCGPGVISNEISKFNVYAVDLSKRMIEEAKKNFKQYKNIKFEIGDVENLKYKDNKFDVVIAMGLFEYFQNGEKALSEMIRVLKPKGSLMVTLPNIHHHEEFLVRMKYYLFNKKDRIKHKRYSIKSFEKILKSGKVVECIHYNVRIFPFDKLWGKLSVAISKKLENVSYPLFNKFLSSGLILEVMKNER